MMTTCPNINGLKFELTAHKESLFYTSFSLVTKEVFVQVSVK